MSPATSTKKKPTAAASAKKPAPRKRRRKRNSRLRVLLRLGAWAGALGVFWFGFLFWQIQTYNPPKQLPPADAIIVLGAALWNDVPSPGLEERLEQAIKVYHEAGEPPIIVSGGLDSGGARVTEAEGMRRYLVERGIPEAQILLEPYARSTYENLLFSKRIMEQSGLKQAIIVTHSYHAARSQDIASYLGYEPAVVSSTKSHVLSSTYHPLREVLAYTKWYLDKLLFSTGIRDSASAS